MLVFEILATPLFVDDTMVYNVVIHMYAFIEEMRQIFVFRWFISYMMLLKLSFY